MLMGPITVVTPPDAGDPVLTLAQAKLHLRVSHSGEDALIAALVAAATEHAQTETRRQLVTATLRMTVDAFPACGVIALHRTPVQAITGITYVDQAGDTQTLAPANYVVDTASAPARVVRADAAVWPSTEPRPNAVAITFTAGYGAAAAVPDGIKAWMLLQVGALYRNREAFATGLSVAELPAAFADRLLDPYRVWVA